MSYISKIQIPGSETLYKIKDSELTVRVGAIETSIASSLIFKGVVGDAATFTDLTNYKIGHTYKASANFEIVGLGKIENGDMLICVKDYTEEFSFSDWTVIQNNIDVMQGATFEQDGTKGLVPAPTTADKDKFLRGDGTWFAINPDISWGKISDLITV